jgi:hypothetical protein
MDPWIVKSKRHVVAVGDLDATATVGPMTSSERCRARPGRAQVVRKATPPEFEAQWPVFLEKLSIPITDRVRQFGEWAAVELRTVMQRLFYEPPLTVIHHDFQADNLLFGRASESVPLVVIDWQMLVRGRGPIDLAYLLSGSVDPEDRRRHELDLVSRYAVSWRQPGFGATTLSNAWRTIAPPCCCRRSGLALAVAYTPDMTATGGHSGTCYSSDRFAPWLTTVRSAHDPDRSWGGPCTEEAAGLPVDVFDVADWQARQLERCGNARAVIWLDGSVCRLVHD